MATVRDHDFVFVPTVVSPDGSPVVCHCLRVTEQQITDAIRAGARTVAELVSMTQAGAGCTACRVRLQQYLIAFHTGSTPPSAETVCNGRCESCPRRSG